MENFNRLLKDIIIKEKYPTPELTFYNIEKIIASPDLFRCIKIMVYNLYTDPEDIVIGVPTRGLIPATLFAAAICCSSINLAKNSILPGHIELCKSGTVYSGDKKSTYSILEESINQIKGRNIYVVDDVSESGETFATIRESLLNLGASKVVCIPILACSEGWKKYDFIKPLMIATGTLILPSKYLAQNFDFCKVYDYSQSSPIAGNTTRVCCPPSLTGMLTNADRLMNVDWNIFSGGDYNIYFEQNPYDKIVFIFDSKLGSHPLYSHLAQAQDFLIDAIARRTKVQMDIVIPFLSQGTMERIDDLNVLATAQSVLRKLTSTLNNNVTLKLVDLHSSVEYFYPADKVKVESHSVMLDIFNRFLEVKSQSEFKYTPVVICFPDEGAAKRFSPLFPNYSIAAFGKKRELDGKRIVKLSNFSGIDPIEGSICVLDDDLVRTGGTLIETSKILKEMGALRVVALFAHVDLNPTKFGVFNDSPIDEIYCSNTAHYNAIKLKERCSKPVHITKFRWGADQRTPSLLREKESVCFNFIENTNGISPQICIVSSGNKGKLQAVSKGLNCKVLSVDVPSLVSEQPYGSDEGKLGATNRTNNAQLVIPSGKLFMSIESYIFGGNRQDQNDIQCQDRVYILLRDSQHKLIEKGIDELCLEIPEKYRIDINTNYCGDKKITVGEQFKKKYNLSDNSSWIALIDAEKLSRFAKIEKIIHKNFH